MSHEDNLLKELGALQREDEQLESTPRGQNLRRPLDADFQQRMLHRLEADLEFSTTAEIQVEASADDTTGTVIQGRFGRRKWLVPLAMAAGVAFLLLPNDSLAPLPEYQAEVSGQVRQQRSAPSAISQATPQFTAASTLEILLRPATAVDGPIEVRAMAISSQGESMLQLHFQHQISDLGVLHLQAPVADLGLASGSWTIVVAAGRPDHLPAWQDLPTATADDTLSIARQPIQVLEALEGHE